MSINKFFPLFLSQIVVQSVMEKEHPLAPIMEGVLDKDIKLEVIE